MCAACVELARTRAFSMTMVFSPRLMGLPSAVMTAPWRI